MKDTIKYNCVIFTRLDIKIIYFIDINVYLHILNDIDDGKYSFKYKQLKKLKYENQEEFDFIIENYEEMKSNLEQPPMIYSPELSGQFTLSIHPSSKCNLNCAYCFRDENADKRKQIDFDVAKKAIDYMITEYAPNAAKYIIDLSGSGEPLLNFELIKKITDYCNTMQDNSGKNVEVMFATNGTVDLDKEKIKYIEDNIIIGISLDGNKETNDINRHDFSGIGSYNRAMKFLNKFENKFLGIAVTITPKNQNVDEIFDDLIKLKQVDCIGMKPVRNFYGNEYDTENINIDRLVNSYKKLCENILEHFSENDFEYITYLLKGNDFFGKYIKACINKNIRFCYPCDAGNQRIAVDALGDIYACTVLTGCKNHHIGNLFTGGVNKLSHEFYDIPSINKNLKCKECEYNYICGGECYVNSLYGKNKKYEPIENLCKLKKRCIELSISLIEKTRILYPEMYKKLYFYIQEVETYHSSNPGNWIIIQYLKSLGIKTKFKLIREKLNNKDVILPNMINDCLSSFGHNLSMYQVQSAEFF